ncbi:MAG: hypothetical protein ACK45H_00980, partial [Bacteroidota bacterium]
FSYFGFQINERHMSEEWKSDRAEASMREGTEAIRKAAEQKAKEEQLQKWEEIKAHLGTLNSEHRDAIGLVIDLMKAHYELPERKDD